jgi:hypothetical protein
MTIEKKKNPNQTAYCSPHMQKIQAANIVAAWIKKI